MTVILAIFMAIALIALLPVWKYSHRWGFLPSGGMMVALILVLWLSLAGHIPFGL